MALEKDVILSKISIIKNCLATIQKVTAGKPQSLDDPIKQDVFVLNLQRAVQACIDMAHIVISDKGLQLPSAYRQAFEILMKNKLLKTETAEKMKKMTGFRNIAIHDYQTISPEILKSILQKNLNDFEEFYKQIYRIYQDK